MIALNQVLNPLAWVFNNERYKRSLLPPEIYDAHFVSKAVTAIQERWTDAGNMPEDESSPIFILSAGWGSGSTLVQRIVMSSKEVLVWGEPYDRAAPVHRISSTISSIAHDWPPESHYSSVRSLDALSKSWVANLAPPIENLRAGHLAFFNAWLGLNGQSHEITRWGLKEVRLTIDHARYLKWLYPNARFLFVYRDLPPGYLGCRRLNWYSVWPNYRATHILRFAHHWQHLVNGFVDGYKDVDGLLIKYEDLVSGQLPLETIRDYINVAAVDTDILNKKVGARSASRTPLILPERLLLDSVAGETRRRLGYRK